MRTSFHHQPEAQHPKSSTIHKLPADYPIFSPKAAENSERRYLSLGASALLTHLP